MRSLLRTKRAYVIVRIAGIFMIALLAILIPEIGPNRFWLAGLLVFAFVPIAVVTELRYPMADHGWSEPVLDILAVVTLIHLIPAGWIPALIIGVMVAGAYSIRASHQSYLFYLLLIGILVVGMSLAAIVHDVPGWEMPIVTILAITPSLMFYSYWEATRASVLRERAQKLQGLVQIAGGVAHNFNNILTSVIGFGDLALIQLGKDHPARESIQEMLGSARRASELSRQLLTFSGRGLADKRIDLGLELNTLVTLLTTATPKGVSLNLEVQEPAPFIEGNRSDLQQIILNIIMNAAEALAHTPALIDITLSSLTESEIPSALIKITSAGYKDDSVQSKKLLHPFFSAVDREQDLGLGTARAALRDLDGDIALEESPDGGTTVTIRIPMLSQEEAQSEIVNPLRSIEAGLVLVIDDEPQIRTLIDEFLITMDIPSIQASDGVEGMDIFRERQKDIMAVILDLHMPRKNGWECLEELRELDPGLPILICSGYDPEESRIELTDARLRYLVKPFFYEDLKTSIEALLAS